jgi:hypothetical protein
VGLGDPGELGLLAGGEILGVLPQRVPGVLQLTGAALRELDSAAALCAWAGLTGGAGLPPGFAADLVDGGRISAALDAAEAAECPSLSVESR